jgi:tRNA pseudouridine32 synthase/23S rRNA pseudouridine746 synthase
MNHFHPLHTDTKRPERFTFPFCYEPHPLCLLAAAEVQQVLESMTLSEGKMYGVLVVEATDGTLGFLAAYSGLLEGRNDWTYFVPPVFDAQQPDGHFKQEERLISAMREESQQEERRQRSQELQQWLFRQYHLLNAHGQEKDLVEVWQDYHCSERIRRKYPLPPGGTGDCCAPKLLQYAYQQGMKPVCMAEFWWGPSPRTEVRQHGHFYPACRGKCKPILTWMLQGLDVDPNPEEEDVRQQQLGIETVYEDDWIIVVNKPSGLLSVPGRIGTHSVATILHERYPNALLAHRLDMGTSGLMVAAKSRSVYVALQQQFADHTVEKRYMALLEGVPAQKKGTISIPLLSDPVNRPRQVVDYERGKEAITDYELVKGALDQRSLATERLRVGASAGIGTQEGWPFTRVWLYPHTGRTHQLRMHCALAEGLGCPIRGDELYGHPADRLYLHADRLVLTHPVSGERLVFERKADF